MPFKTSWKPFSPNFGWLWPAVVACLTSPCQSVTRIFCRSSSSTPPWMFPPCGYQDDCSATAPKSAPLASTAPKCCHRPAMSEVTTASGASTMSRCTAGRSSAANSGSVAHSARPAATGPAASAST